MVELYGNILEPSSKRVSVRRLCIYVSIRDIGNELAQGNQMHSITQIEKKVNRKTQKKKYILVCVCKC